MSSLILVLKVAAFLNSVVPLGNYFGMEVTEVNKIAVIIGKGRHVYMSQIRLDCLRCAVFSLQSVAFDVNLIYLVQTIKFANRV